MHPTEKASAMMLERVWLRDENTRLSNEVIRLMAEVAELRGQDKEDWSHLPEGGEWYVGISKGAYTQIVHDDDGDTTGFFACDSHDPKADWGHCGYRRLTRAEAIAIFEKNRKGNYTPETGDRTPASVTSAMPPATPAFKVGDDASPTQPPMSRERFRQEAAIAAMGKLIVHLADSDPDEITSDSASYANSLADAVFGEGNR